jgi:hypothetical protein
MYTVEKLLALVFQENARAKEDYRYSITKVPPPDLPLEAAKLRSEARKNKEHFGAIMLQDKIPDGEPQSFVDLTEFEVTHGDDSEAMSKAVNMRTLTMICQTISARTYTNQSQRNPLTGRLSRSCRQPASSTNGCGTTRGNLLEPSGQKRQQ